MAITAGANRILWMFFPPQKGLGPSQQCQRDGGARRLPALGQGGGNWRENLGKNVGNLRKIWRNVGKSWENLGKMMDKCWEISGKWWEDDGTFGGI